MGFFDFFRGRSQRFYNSTDINTAPINIDRRYLGNYHSLLPQEPFESDDAYYQRLVTKFGNKVRNLDKAGAAYNPNPTSLYFPQKVYDPNKKAYVSLDIETDDYGHPISISALRFQYNHQTRQFESTDNYQRFYKTHGWDIRSTQAVHGFTPAILNSLRKQQGATYGATYKGSEIESLKAFLGNSIIVGHNIQQFDLNKLFPDEVIGNSTIDTLAAARNAWHGKRNDLDSVFHRLFGKSMEQAGLSHHDANADTLAAMMILGKMAANEGTVGQSIRHVMHSKTSKHLVEYDALLDSMITRGTYKSMYGGAGKILNEVYMTGKEAGIINSKGEWVGGFHEDIPTNPDQMTDEQLLKSALVDATQYLKKKGGNVGVANMSGDLFEAVNQFNNYKRLSLVKQIASAKSEESATALARAAGYSAEGKGYETLREMADAVKSARNKEVLGVEDMKKERYLNRMERRHYISAEQREELGKLSGSYHDVVDATEEVIEANQKLAKVYKNISSIKPYDINNLIATGKNQFGGIMGASRGVVPDFIRSTVGRLGDATFNAIDRSISPWNAFNRSFNAIVGPFMGGGGGGMGGGMGGVTGGGMSKFGTGAGVALGIVNAGTQIAGNVAQAKLEMRGLNIQNNLNTLGALISWISTPFQLLHKATKLLIGSFGGLTLKLNNIMGTGINDMTQMGNPLEPLTGVNYTDYLGTTLMDRASLLGKGSTNTAIEDFAKMQRDLYRFGKVDTNKLLAANMLGVFNEAFTPTTDAQGAYTNMANKVLRNMQGQTKEQQADTMYYLTQLNGTLAQTVRSALMMGITDVRELSNPSAFHQMYWRPLTEREEGRFRRTQFEYGAATQQFGFTKMRFADRLWNAVGRDIYNGFNRLIDSAAEGNWKDVLATASDMWETLKIKVKSVWDGLNEGGDISAGLSKGWEKIKEWGIKIANGIIDIWDKIFLAVLNKAQGLIAYLSTVQVGFEKDKKTGKWGISINTIGDAPDLKMDSDIYNSAGRVHSGMEAIDRLAAKYIPYYEENKLYKHTTPRQLAYALGQASMAGDGITFEEYGIKNYKVLHEQDAYDLLNMLWKGESGGTGFRKQAAAWLAPEKLREHMDESAYHLPIYDMAKDFVDKEQAIRYEASRHFIEPKEDKDSKVTFDFKLGNKTVTAEWEQGRGVSVTGVPLLQQVGIGNGMSVAVSKQH